MLPPWENMLPQWKNMLPISKKCHLFTVETVFFNENFSIFLKILQFFKKKNAACGRNYATKTKIMLFMIFFFGKTLECKLCFIYAGTIAQGFLCYLQKKYATSKRQIMLLTTKKCKKMLPAAENKLLNQKLSFLC